MSSLEIFIPDDMEKQIKAKGMQPEDLILDLLREYFIRQDRAETELATASKAGGTETKATKHNEKRRSQNAVKEFMEKAKDAETSVQRMIETQHQTERLVGQLENAVKSTEIVFNESHKSITRDKKRTQKRSRSNKKPGEKGR